MPPPLRPPEQDDPELRPRRGTRLLEAARVNEHAARRAGTGYLWGEPTLRAYVERSSSRPKAKDDRLEQVARRYLR
jgi:hypothetical protein